jgi:hypothetical protein
MRLPGRLSVTTLGDLLGALYRARVDGVLELVEQSGALAGRTHRIRLDRGLVAQVETPLKVPRLGDLLRGEGFLDERAVRRLTERIVALPHQTAGSILVEEGFCTQELLVAALRQQLKTRLEAVFGIGEARVTFHVACPRGKEAGVPLPLSPLETLRGRPRRRTRTGTTVGPRPCEAEPRGTHPGIPDRGQTDPSHAGQHFPGQASELPVPRGFDASRARALRVLGLCLGADRTTVQRAFRRLAADLHPDRHPSASSAERTHLMRRFAELSAAYHQLLG